MSIDKYIDESEYGCEDLSQEYSIAGGSIIGSAHSKPGDFGGTNNQDAFSILSMPDALIGVVCDGCSAGKHSEVGAKLASDMLTRIIYRHKEHLKHTKHRFTSHWVIADDGFEIIENQLLSYITNIVQGLSLGDNHRGFENAVENYMLFTVVGFIMMENITHTFYLGDGKILVNGKDKSPPPPPGNAPAYFGFKLTAPRHHSMNSLRFKHDEYETKDIQSIIVGSDGLDYLDEANKEGYTIKNKPDGKPVGDTSQFIDDVFLRKHPSNINKRLGLINQEIVNGKQIRPGPLKDDTTLIVVGRNR